MIFSDSIFFAFFGIFFVLYFALRKHLGAQNLLTLAASYVFYGWWDPRFLTLVAISTGADYLAAIGAGGDRIAWRQTGLVMAFVGGLAALLVAMGVPRPEFVIWGSAAFMIFPVAMTLAVNHLSKETARKIALWATIIVNLGILAFFKYFNFFTDNFAVVLRSVGFEADFVTLNVLLPVGISFYTFQTMSYTIDVYYGRMKPTHNFWRFASYVAFFPQLVAGPIERAETLLPQFDVLRKLDWERARSGAMLFLWGYYKKTVIADNLAGTADRVFANPSASPEELLAGLLAFTFQIYADFSGYTDMARGVSRILGFELMRNFRMPYFSRTPSEFWQRWHISLSSWLRDYLYIALGGNRRGSLMTYRNLMLTMLIGGFWHGAAWTFIFWGFLHGLILVVARFFKLDDFVFKSDPKTVRGAAIHTVSALGMFAAAAIIWIPFRAQTFSDTWYFMTHLFSAVPQGLGTIAFYAGPLVLIELVTRLRGCQNPWDGVKGWPLFTLILFVGYSAFLLQSKVEQAFIYFDF